MLKLLRRFGFGGRVRTRGAVAVPRDQADEIVMYTTRWCGDCRRAKRVFTALGVPYREVDIEEDDAACELVLRLNDSMACVPTILFPDGTRLVEPASSALEAKLLA